MIKILHVDDESQLTDLLRLNLERTGRFTVKTENLSRRALQTAREFQPDVILLDIIMPGLDGGDLAGQFQADPALSSVPVILVSALVSANESDGESISINGGHVVVPKPVRISHLIKSIDYVLSSDGAPKP
jgi:two-component system OmpR family response regulator